jgi:hypothetical protein
LDGDATVAIGHALFSGFSEKVFFVDFGSFYYAPRMVKLHLAEHDVDAALKELTEGAPDVDEREVERRKSRWAALAAAAGAESRIKELAKDLLGHFRLYQALRTLPDCPEIKVVMTGDLGKDPKEWSEADRANDRGSVSRRPQSRARRAPQAGRTGTCARAVTGGPSARPPTCQCYGSVMRLSMGVMLLGLCAACGGKTSGVPIADASDATNVSLVDDGEPDAAGSSESDGAATAPRIDPCFLGAGQCLYIGLNCPGESLSPSTCGPGLFCCATLVTLHH